MTKTDTSREAVERYLDARKKHLGTTSDQERIHSVGLPNCEIATLTTTDIRALLTERDQLQARAERTEAGLKVLLEVSARAVRLSLDYSDFKLYAMEPMERAIDTASATLAQLDAEPAEWPECVHMTAEMARNCPKCNPSPITRNDSDEYFLKTVGAGDVSEPVDVSDTDKAVLGLMEKEKLRREGWEQAKEAAAQYLESQAPFTEKQISGATSLDLLDNISQVDRSRNCRKDAADIRAMPYPGDSQ